ncbi:Spermidine/putrescine import ATP-binding protein PotA [Roseivivax jejudonensis]|uniref:Spermidine/putrescine import ATP-binding protein PotA n=1 Tax=Roseivivax jejudonensis TaxID=1529041 RepID=A0A1X6Y3N9_9RHOB|nr:ABC transporter ATP-binding protein [Roseivivax jejudonensis]SLN09886.1 Spermidine/putrescine import ATP-binding protein PotA [Roseivivax jejudonensis]
MSDHDLELVKLKKVYPGGTLAVEAFDLKVKKGEFISFVGPSGCGKTTTLRMIAGLESITSGNLLIRGKDFTTVRAEDRPTATIFQNYAIFPHMTVAENIAFGLQVRGKEPAEVKRRVDAIIETLQIGDIRDARESALSGGQKQRVSLARGLVTEPDILLLDEPLGALDANLRKSIQEELKILQRDLGITFIFVTHAQSEALSMGDRVVVMNSGRVEQISEPFELYTRPKSPFVARFIGRNKIIEGKLGGLSDGRATVETAFGPLAGIPSFDAGHVASGGAVFVVAPSEYVEILPAGQAAAEPGYDTISGTVSTIEPVGQVVYVTVELPGMAPIRIEAYRDKIEGAGLAPGASVDLRWKAERATVVAA